METSKSSLQSRAWICTLHVDEQPLDPLPVLPADSPISYAVGQLEKGEESGAIHWQFFTYFSKKKRLAGVKSALVDWLGEYASSTHLERCRGTIQQNIDYCSKSDTRIGMSFNYGDPPVVYRSGRELLAHFRSGAKLDASDPRWDDVLLRFSASRLEELSALVSPRSRDPSNPPVCEVHYGPPGSGKSRSVFRSFPGAYIKPSGKWWDHYHGETTVILDDFDGSSLSFGDFKRYVDRYPTYVEIKGGVVPLLATTWILTTNVYPSHWWSRKVTAQDGRDAIWRRLSLMVEYISAEVDPREFDPAQFRLLNMFLETQDPKGEKAE